jgi:hypothetical protein
MEDMLRAALVRHALKEHGCVPASVQQWKRPRRNQLSQRAM